ncbi:MAG: hypothetical protein JWO71_2474 [Candidatus Acidoferrum typicum]|nr:hypothetical protein [Candidatus Acidoferrum typicum]
MIIVKHQEVRIFTRRMPDDFPRPAGSPLVPYDAARFNRANFFQDKKKDKRGVCLVVCTHKAQHGAAPGGSAQKEQK